MPSSTRIKWFDTAVAYIYTYTNVENSLAFNIAIREIQKPGRMMSRRHTFRGEADAIISQKKKKQNEHTEHYQKIKPDLAKYHWSQMTIHELEAAELELIDKLDSIRQVDAFTGFSIYSNQYIELEKELSLLLEMYECLFQERIVENHVSQNNDEAASITKKRNLRRSLRFFSPFTKCLRITVDDESGGTYTQ